MDINFAQKKILVTGGTGFVGSHLIEALINKGAEVITTHQSFSEKSYFATQQLGKKAQKYHIDITDYKSLETLLDQHKIQYIFHLAAQPLVEVAYKNPVRTMESNIMGTVSLLEYTRLHPSVEALIVASSDKAYGKLKSGKYSEVDPLRGDHPYEVSKSASDLICNSYYQTYKVPVVVTRFGNIYGEGDLHFSRIIPSIAKAVATGETLELRSDGTNVRDYLYVKDVVDGYLLIANNISKVVGEAFNFGSPETLSVLELIAHVEKELNVKISYQILNMAKNEIPFQSLDYGKIGQQLGWNTRCTLQSTIVEIFKWYKNYLVKEL